MTEHSSPAAAPPGLAASETHPEADLSVSKGIKRRVFIPLIIGVGVLLASFILTLRHDQNRLADLEIERSAREVQRLLRVEQEESAALMQTAIQGIMSDPVIVQSFRSRDRETLLQRSSALFQELSSHHKITHLYFHGADRVNFLRVHRPDKAGDLIDRLTLRAAERTGKTATGLEKGMSGVFVLRVVTPWREKGQLLGYVELGMEFREIARALHGLLDVDFVLAVEKKFLDREQWKRAVAEENKQHSWDQFREMVIIDQTMRVLPESVANVLSVHSPGAEAMASEVTWNGRVARVMKLRLEEVGGRGVGELFVVQDITESAAQARQSIWVVTLICLGVSAILLGVLYLFLGCVSNTLVEQTAALQSEIKERQRSAQTLRESELKFLQMADNITDVFWITAPDLGTMHYISPGYKAIWGRSTASLYADPHQWIDVIVPEDRAAVTALFVSLTQNAPEVSVEYRIARPDGGIRWVHDRGFQVRNKAGELIRLTGIARDITEQKKSAETLREKERRFRAYFELGLFGMAIMSPSKGFLEVNNELCRILGYERSEILHKTWPELTHPDDLAAGVTQFQRVIAGETDGYTLDKRFLRKDGRVIDATISVACIRRADRSVDYLVALLQDITERKQAEAARREAEENYRSIYENSNDGIFQNTPEGRVISANPALARILGYDSPEELVRERTDVATQGYCEPGQRERFRRLLEKRGVIRDFEYEVLRKDGSRIWVSENTRIVRDAAGRSLYYEGSLLDITARKRAEENLFQSRETLRGILDHIPQRIFWKDCDLVYQGCNQSFALEMGFSDTSSVLGKTDLDAVWKDLAETYRADDQSVIDSNQGKASFEEPGVDADGRPRWLRTSKIPLHDWQGKVTGVLGTYEDVTEHKLAKLEIERLNVDLERRVAERTSDLVAVTKEAERANHAKSEFLSRTSHELRTPMNAILGFGQLLEMEEDLGPESRESVEQILNAGRHLLNLIDEVLNISHAESGRMVLACEPFEVGQFLRETLRLVGPLCTALRVQLEPLSWREDDCRVWADPQRLRQVLLNLLNNAIKYNRPGGSVELECVRRPAADPPALRICVRDTGPGISATNLPRLFTPFDRLDAERRAPQVVGTGLGLSLSKRLIELMGGSLGVKSVPGEGSTFWIDVPLAEEPGEMAAAGCAPPSHLHSG